MAKYQLDQKVTELDFANTVATLIVTDSTGEKLSFKESDCKHQNQSLIIEIKEDDGQRTIICLICDNILDSEQPNYHKLTESASVDSTNTYSPLCPCGNSESSKFDTIQESTHFSLVCKICHQIQSFSDQKQSSKEHTSIYKKTSETVRDDPKGSLCSCGNNNPYLFDHMEDENHFSLNCKSCESVISFEENETSSDNRSKSNQVNVDYSLQERMHETENDALCSVCGNADPKKFDHIEEENHFSLICKACDHITSYREDNPCKDAIEGNELSLDMSLINLNDDTCENKGCETLIYHPDARIVVCSLCEKMWNYREDNSIPLEAEMHIHEDKFEENESNKTTSNNSVLCNKAPKWEKVKSKVLLSRGDHVCFWNGYWRHAIISDVFNNKVSLIGYRFKPKCQIIEEVFPVDKFNFQRAIYSGKTHSKDVVITRARSRLGEQRYNVFTNYARAFPRWCKTDYGGICSINPSDLGAFHISQSEATGHEQVLDISALNVGDHIKWWRKGLHWHHAIVMNICSNGKEKYVDVIHYTLMDIPNNFAGFIAKLIEKWRWVEVAVERLKWCLEDKKLVSYTATLGTQCSHMPQEHNSKRAAALACNSFSVESFSSSGKRSVCIQTDDWLQNSEVEGTSLENQQFQVEYDESLIDSNNTDMNMPENDLDVDSAEDAANHPDPGLLYKVIYSGSTYAVDIILKKAKSKIGEANYLLLKKNCEHLVTWCCTGQSKSKQVDSLVQHGTPLTSQGIQGTLKMLEALLSAMPETAPKIVSSARAALSKILKFIPVEVAAFAVYAIIEVIIKSINIFKACKACQNGTLSKKERNILILKEISEGACSIIVGGSVGWLLGYFIPVPILGNTIGVVIGAITGHIAGRMIGYKFAERQKLKAIEQGKKDKLN